MAESKQQVRLGQTVMTRGIAVRLEQDGKFASGVMTSIAKYKAGDWGDLGEEDKQMNEEALQTKDRIMGAYDIGSDRIWIITDAGHKVTTILFPDEY